MTKPLTSDTGSAHTPGPWTVGDTAIWALDDCEFHAIADCPVNHTCRDAETMLANARLIAAAPGVLEAAKWVLALIDGREQMPAPDDEVAAELRAAIARATGEA
jgi:hypothetical protein